MALAFSSRVMSLASPWISTGSNGSSRGLGGSGRRVDVENLAGTDVQQVAINLGAAGGVGDGARDCRDGQWHRRQRPYQGGRFRRPDDGEQTAAPRNTRMASIQLIRLRIQVVCAGLWGDAAATATVPAPSTMRGGLCGPTDDCCKLLPSWFAQR